VKYLLGTSSLFNYDATHELPMWCMLGAKHSHKLGVFNWLGKVNVSSHCNISHTRMFPPNITFLLPLLGGDYNFMVSQVTFQ
jgi:hypothetical protein